MRSRNIKPGFFKNDILGTMDPLARILFSGLWCLADREGRLSDRPMRIKAEILPFDDCDINLFLEGLSENGFIRRYEKGGERYIQIVNFKKHQHPNIKEAESEIPPESDISCCESVLHGASFPLNPKPNTLNLKPHTDIDAEAVLDTFMEVTGKSYRDRASQVRLIRSALSRGFTKDDLENVCRKMKRLWQGTKYERFLTPSTLFGEKLEDYLNLSEQRSKRGGYFTNYGSEDPPELLALCNRGISFETGSDKS